MPRQKLLVIDISATGSMALTERAKMLASALHMDVHFYCLILQENARFCELSDSRHLKCERRLRNHAEKLERAGVTVETQTQSVPSLREAALRCVNSVRPGLVLTGSASANPVHAQEADQLVDDLLERTHCDIWVVQRTAEAGRRAMLAAINIDSKSAPARIREKVLSKTADFSRKLNAHAHVVHTYRISKKTELAADLLPKGVPASEPQDIESRHVKETHDALQRFKFRKDSVHVIQGDLTKELRRLVVSMDIDVIVVGATTKGSLFRRMFTSYPRQLIDNLPCDVLIVRP